MDDFFCNTSVTYRQKKVIKVVVCFKDALDIKILLEQEKACETREKVKLLLQLADTLVEKVKLLFFVKFFAGENELFMCL